MPLLSHFQLAHHADKYQRVQVAANDAMTTATAIMIIAKVDMIATGPWPRGQGSFWWCGAARGIGCDLSDGHIAVRSARRA